MHDALTLWDQILRLGGALVLGGMIGWERERKEKTAGIRTMMLVALGASGFMVLTGELLAVLPDDVAVDPTRVVAGVIGGIGFLGAGAIIQSRGSVHGMTTAATIWTAAGIGLACGAGAFRVALLITALVLLTLVAIALKGRRERAR